MPKDSALKTQTKADQAVLSIPEDVSAKFPEIIEMIKRSKSMNNEEGQYWVDVLPIMSEDQIQNLRNILLNEKKQIEKVNQSYSSGMKKIADKAVQTFNETSYIEKKRARQEAEKLNEEKDEENEAKLLKELENL